MVSEEQTHGPVFRHHHQWPPPPPKQQQAKDEQLNMVLAKI